MFGVLWWRTRSLLLVVLLHGAVDMLPHTAEMARLLGLDGGLQVEKKRSP
jgi:membrane protease YdiL (CAAX protease family)